MIKGDWTPVNDDNSGSIHDALHGKLAEANEEGGPFDITDITACRPSFYPGILGLQCTVLKRGRAEGVATFALAGEDLVLFDGGSPVVHRLNLLHGLDLSTEDQARDYFAFFCNAIQSDGGVFKVVEDVAALPWRGGEDTQSPEVPAGLDCRAVLSRVGADGAGIGDGAMWSAEAFIAYQSNLFVAYFTIHRGGMVKMHDDDVQVQDLPLLVEKFENGIRRLS